MTHLRTAVFFFCVSACASSSRAPFRELDRPAVTGARTKEHAVRGAEIRDAVARGDLEGARRAADAFIVLATEGEASGPETRLGKAIQAARGVRNAKDLHEAAYSLALMSQRCGSCHLAFGGPKSFVDFPPPRAHGLTPRMERLHWAATRLWEGLAAPSADAWANGASVLAEPALTAEEIAPGDPRAEDLGDLAEDVRIFGTRGTKPGTHEQRLEIYADVIGTCAECHRRLGRGPASPGPIAPRRR